MSPGRLDEVVQTSRGCGGDLAETSRLLYNLSQGLHYIKHVFPLRVQNVKYRLQRSAIDMTSSNERWSILDGLTLHKSCWCGRIEMGSKDIIDGYLASIPAKLAHAAREYSVGNEDRVKTYLCRAFRPSVRPSETHPQLPHHVHALLKVQGEDGRWVPCAEVTGALGPHMPDPPQTGTVRGWRWITALVVAFLRRDCNSLLDNDDTLLLAYRRAKGLLSDEVLEEARKRLPPRDVYFRLDPDLIKAGRWRDSELVEMAAGGYMRFLSADMLERVKRALADQHDDLSTVTSMSTEPATAESDWWLQDDRLQPSGDIRRDARDKARMLAIARRHRQKEEWRQSMLEREYKQLTQPSPDRQARNLTVLQQLWTQQVSQKVELQRLKNLDVYEDSHRKPWQSPARAVEFEATKRVPLAALASAHILPSGADFPSKVKRRRHRDKGALHTPEHRPKGTVQAVRQTVQLMEGDRVATEAVQAILALEAFVEEIRGALQRCLVKYRSSRLQRDRLEILDEITAMLGHSQPPRAGWVGWIGKGTLGMHVHIFNVVERVVKWREVIFKEEKARAAAEAAAETDVVKALELNNRVKALRPSHKPFLWKGENVILTLPYVLEWLYEYRELVDHYGADFVWRRNPFMWAVGLDERAPTPRSAIRTVRRGDELVGEVSQSLLELKKQDEQRVLSMEAKIANAPFFWPCVGVTKEHVARIRTCEKVILQEEAVYGRRDDLSAFRRRNLALPQTSTRST